MTSTIETSTTTKVCPWWCITSTNHLEWSLLTRRTNEGMTQSRFHVRDFDDHVALVQVEYRDDEGTRQLGEPAVYVVDFEDEHMPSAQAREHAAHVLAAADLLDRVVAGR